MGLRYKVEQFAGKYLITWPLSTDGLGEAITAQVDRIKEHRDGRLTARVKISASLITGKEELHQGQLNLVAVRSRRELASALFSRLDREDINWDQIIEEMCREVTEREEKTSEAEQLALAEPSDPKFLVYPLILERLPVVWYGPGASGKTMFAFYFSLLVQNGLPFLDQPVPQTNVLYCDWEVDREEAERRVSFMARYLERTTGQRIELPFYRRCILPLSEEASEIAEDAARCNAGLIIIDSAGPACGGDIQSAELAVQFFNALRKIYAPINASVVVLTHVTKGERRDGRQQRLPIGSIYFENLPRATWELRPQEDDGDDIAVGFFCRKANLFQKPKPLGLKLEFGGDEIAVSITRAEEVKTEEATLGEMILEALKAGPASAKEIALEIGVAPNVAWAILSRLKNRNRVVNVSRGRWALAADNVVNLKKPDDDVPF